MKDAVVCGRLPAVPGCRPDEGVALALLAAVKIAIGIGLLSYATIGAGGRAWPRLIAIAAGLAIVFAPL